MTKKATSLRRWHVSLLTGTPAKFLGYVEARDVGAAIEVAVRKYRISDTLRHKIAYGGRSTGRAIEITPAESAALPALRIAAPRTPFANTSGQGYICWRLNRC